jgi:hypothetical protein
LRQHPGRGFRALCGHEFEGALRRRARLTFPQLRGRPACPKCGLLMDAFGDHAERCTALRHMDVYVHNGVRDELFAIGTEIGLGPYLEEPGLIEGTRERPADCFFPGHLDHGLNMLAEHAGRSACVDVSGVSSLCPSYIDKAVMVPLRERHRTKERRKVPDDDLFVVPIVFSSFGCFLKDGLAPVMGAFAARFKAGESERAEAAGAAAVDSRWLPRLSTAVQRGCWRRLSAIISGVSRGGAVLLQDSDLQWSSRAIARQIAAAGRRSMAARP